MYMLRRGSRAEISTAVRHLLTLYGCNKGVEGCVPSESTVESDAINDMRSAGMAMLQFYCFVHCSRYVKYIRIVVT